MKKERKKGERRAGRPWLTHQCTVRENTWTWPPLRVCVRVCVRARVFEPNGLDACALLSRARAVDYHCCKLHTRIVWLCETERGCSPSLSSRDIFHSNFLFFFFFLQRERVKKIVIEWRWRGVFEKSFKFRIYSRGEILGCYESNLSWKLFTRIKSFESFARCLSRGIKKYIFSTSLESFSFESVMLFFRSTLLPFLTNFVIAPKLIDPMNDS